MNAMVRAETGFRAQQGRSGDAFPKQEGKDFVAQVIALGTRVFVEVDRDFFGRSRREQHQSSPLRASDPARLFSFLTPARRFCA